MKNRIERHKLVSPVIGRRAATFKNRIENLKDLLTKDPQDAGENFNFGFDSIGDSIVCDYPRLETMIFIQRVAELGVNHFRNSTAEPNTTVRLKLNENEFDVKSKPEKSYNDPTYWGKRFYCAILARNEDAIKELVNIPESVLRNAAVKYGEVDFAIVRFLKGLYQDCDLGDLLIEALDLTDPDKHEKARFDYLMRLKFPELNLYQFILEEDNNGFNKALKYALEQHKKFWEKNSNNSAGWISFPLLTACIIAYNEFNINIEIESDYIPMWLITGDF